MTRNARTMAILLSAALVGAVGCDKKDESSPAAPAASSVAPSVTAPTGMFIKYAIDPGGKTAIDMPAPKEHIKADTTALAGELRRSTSRTLSRIAAAR